MNDARIERVAEAICTRDRLFHMRRGGYRPTWRELLDSTSHEGHRRADEYREMARDALAAADQDPDHPVAQLRAAERYLLAFPNATAARERMRAALAAATPQPSQEPAGTAAAGAAGS